MVTRFDHDWSKAGFCYFNFFCMLNVNEMGKSKSIYGSNVRLIFRLSKIRHKLIKNSWQANQAYIQMQCTHAFVFYF